jgi:hypothetical protein
VFKATVHVHTWRAVFRKKAADLLGVRFSLSTACDSPRLSSRALSQKTQKLSNTLVDLVWADLFFHFFRQVHKYVDNFNLQSMRNVQEKQSKDPKHLYLEDPDFGIPLWTPMFHVHLKTLKPKEM